MSKTKLAIVIPVYNNPELLTGCLESLRGQVNRNFEILIFDDASTSSYSNVLDKFKDLNISYRRNEKNLGALQNMSFAYNESANSFDYVMIMHEDDQLAPGFTKAVIDILDKESDDPAFFITRYFEFPQYTNINIFNDDADDLMPRFSINDPQQLCFRFLQNEGLAFGSVVYNTRYFKSLSLYLERYGEFADRPLLLTPLKKNASIVVIEKELYAYRAHTENDNRWKLLNCQHVFNLVNYYKTILVDSAFLTKKIFRKWATGFIAESYKNLRLTAHRPAYLNYLAKGYLHGLVSIKYALLKNSRINKAATFAKALFK